MAIRYQNREHSIRGTPMTDTHPFDPALFDEAAIDRETVNLNAQMIEMLTGQPEWWIVGAQAAREARRRGGALSPHPCSRIGLV